ncbi:hypothetical protein ACCD06_13920 [Azospirillum sp. CT11-132]|uniref:type II toxin-antitoxin system RelE/ParE family toxin n=1 Tax=unclassified Azospirillum TaxID=2630922 RepID=UPI000D61A0EA|nr:MULTISPECIES: type II toxin-antitoxin system RelE/ParE family toxin [unclassified Azospirillum]PWC66972.1 hypothetical protein TSH7_05305 [Azospirillum sp. TSH7]
MPAHPYKVRLAAPVARDFNLIEAHLIEAYQALGDDEERAADRAAARVDEAADYLQELAALPYRGTEHPGIRPGLRTVTKNKFVIYFRVHEERAEVLVVAVFFGGMDHRRQIVDRLRHR